MGAVRAVAVFLFVVAVATSASGYWMPAFAGMTRAPQ